MKEKDNGKREEKKPHTQNSRGLLTWEAAECNFVRMYINKQTPGLRTRGTSNVCTIFVWSSLLVPDRTPHSQTFLNEPGTLCRVSKGYNAS